MNFHGLHMQHFLFKYKDGADTTNNVLNNKINFRFKEVPKIQINTTIDTLEDIYPDYESQEYLFTVEGLNSENEINNAVERLYIVENKLGIDEEKIRSCKRRIDDLEHEKGRN